MAGLLIRYPNPWSNNMIRPVGPAVNAAVGQSSPLPVGRSSNSSQDDHSPYHQHDHCPIGPRVPLEEQAGGIARQIEANLRLFVAENQIVELLILDAELPGLRTPVRMFGFYDPEHLADMATEAANHSGRAKGIYFTLNPLQPDLIARCCNRVKLARQGDPAGDEHVLRRRWFLVDADPCRLRGVSATDTEKETARERIEAVRSFLAGEGWPRPIYADSGNGFHLLYRIDLPCNDDNLLQQCLTALADRFDDDAVKIDKTVHNPVRVTKLYGTISCKGDSLRDRPHRPSAILEVPPGIEVVPQEQIDRLAAASMRLTPSGSEQTRRSFSSDRQSVQGRARAYLANMPPAISGQQGHNQTFWVACQLVQGFGLSTEEALPLMQEWNRECQPPWSDAELRHKLEDAGNRRGERGYLLNSRSSSIMGSITAGAIAPTFPIAVPDFLLVDSSLALYPIRPPGHRGRPGILGVAVCVWLMHLLAQTQRRRPVLIPDVLVRDAIWGASGWPTHWRRKISRNFFRPIDAEGETSTCNGLCPLFGSGRRHRHYQPKQDLDLGCLEVYGSDLGDGTRQYDFHPNMRELPEDMGNRIKEGRRSGRIFSLYFPLLLFGRSPRVALSGMQYLLLLGVVRELTRIRRRSVRPDHAAIFANGMLLDSFGTELIPCPILDANQSYVCFGGNGKPAHAGRGYGLIGRSSCGWLSRAGYTPEMIEHDRWGCVRRFLSDIAALADQFGLVTVARHARADEWHDLGNIQSMTCSQSGRAKLEQVRIRFLTSADYLARWRHYFANRLGYSRIPGGYDDQPPQESLTVGPILSSAAAVKRWLRENRISQRDLAARMGCSPAWVSQQLSGSKTWSVNFQQRVMQLAEQIALPGTRH